MFINSNTELYTIFGNPVKHSLSPAMQNAAFSYLDINSVYMAFQPDSIGNAIQTVKTLNIKGSSITIPFKIEVIEFLDEVDNLAKMIGSVNTLKNVNGKITGYNTDGYGAYISILNKSIDIKKSKILIIGNGGSARAIAFTLLKNGAAITITGRNEVKIDSLVTDLKKLNNNVNYILLNKLTKEYMHDIDIIINTTPVGMAPDTDKTPLNTELLLSRHIVFDIIYAPHYTLLLKAAESKGCTVIHGVDMLLNQGVKQFEIWTAREAPVEIMHSALINAIEHREKSK